MRDRRRPGWLADDEPPDASDSFDDADDVIDAEPLELDDGFSVTGLGPASASPWQLRLANVTPRLRGLWRLSGGVALAALVAIVVVALAPHLPRPAPARMQIPYTALAASSAVARCLNGVAWSPDGREVASVQSPTCSAPYMEPGALNSNLVLFDAATGRQIATYALDSAVDTALARSGLTSSNNIAYSVSYYAAHWSPNARSIAVEFTVYSDQMNDTGIAVVTLSGAGRGHVSVALNAPNASIAPPANGFDLIPVTRWDLTRGDQTTIFLAPALAYRWLPSDVLTAAEPLAATASAPAPVEPSTSVASASAMGAAAAAAAAAATATTADEALGGQTFSMWSAGAISPVTAVACGANGVTTQALPQPYALLWLTATAWSPDGRYLIDSAVQARLPVAAGRPLASANGASPCDSGPPPDQLPSAPLHDKALAAALRLLDAQGANQLSLAWSPDGQRLAVTALNLASQSGQTVIFDSATGATLASYTGDEFAATSGGVYSVQNPVWSPNGHSLLLTISGPAAKLVILGPQALGR